ncbi:hypothetical protein DSM3645_27488 [Blastopirellula marina DSM 3645]|uniref:Uncharacterized protein n=1 Tax=Blastopirellula marina DSM 3645 TaxID=314230 RepID=A3ZX19_9BACT|nr:hypothetical protein DSM3645_27488 [Blastopirellula marina DSM 3645]
MAKLMRRPGTSIRWGVQVIEDRRSLSGVESLQIKQNLV